MTHPIDPNEQPYQVLASSCASSSCPTVYADEEAIVVQGYIDRLPTPEGEQAVRIPRDLFVDAARSMLGDATHS